jgi:hypothetical protein
MESPALVSVARPYLNDLELLSADFQTRKEMCDMREFRAAGRRIAERWMAGGEIASGPARDIVSKH